MDNIDKITKEGGGSDKFFTGIELKDTGAEKSVYNNLKSTGFILNVATPEDSSLGIAKKISGELSNPNGLTGLGKKFILESLNQLKDDELVLAPSDVHPSVANFSDNPVGRQTYSVKFNNLFVSDIVSRANRMPTSVFQDELFSMANSAKDFQENTLSKIGSDPTKMNEDEFTIHVDAFEILSNNPFNASNETKEYEITILGYMIEKTEILPNESIRTFDPIIVNDPKNLFVKDEQVRYGGNYLYTVRTICQVIAPVLKVDPVNPILDEIVYAKFLMASEGISDSVLCVEKVPPPPPAAIRARFNFSQKSPVITWQFPVNPQRDIRRFQVFKRESVNQPFVLVAEYDFDDSIIKSGVNEIAQQKNYIKVERPRLSYLDPDFNIASTPIYAVASVDAHGMSSNLSSQIMVKYDKLKNKLTLKLASREGAPKQYPNIYLEQDTFKDVMTTSGYERMHLFFDPEYYRLVQNSKSNIQGVNKEEDLKLLAVNPDTPTYSMQIINLDMQKEQIVNITIEDVSGIPKRITASSFGESFVTNKK